jgi:hypothetical protein
MSPGQPSQFWSMSERQAKSSIISSGALLPVNATVFRTIGKTAKKR